MIVIRALFNGNPEIARYRRLDYDYAFILVHGNIIQTGRHWKNIGLRSHSAGDMEEEVEANDEVKDIFNRLNLLLS